MKASIKMRLCGLAAAGLVVLAGCGRTTSIKSDLVLESDSGARIDLHQRTQAIELMNDSDAVVRVRVLGKRDRVVSDMLLNGHDQVRLDLQPAKAVKFNNDSFDNATIRWRLENDNLIEYSLAMTPANR
ncbi:MAG: hypothetical protein ACYS0D_06535 [Planctomycetota bacterium]|jgi:hypothetical protein